MTSWSTSIASRALQFPLARADSTVMDALGARCLAARIRAGVRVGSRIEILDTPPKGSNLVVGDRGVVRGFTTEGYVVVAFEDRFHTIEIDPELTQYRNLAA